MPLSLDDVSANQAALVRAIKGLLDAAEKGELTGLCYARVNGKATLSYGFFGTSDCGAHELLCVSELLTFRHWSRDARNRDSSSLPSSRHENISAGNR